jgi:hypothetical protein
MQQEMPQLVTHNRRKDSTHLAGTLAWIPDSLELDSLRLRHHIQVYTPYSIHLRPLSVYLHHIVEQYKFSVCM